jgi:hypothetical protein
VIGAVTSKSRAENRSHGELNSKLDFRRVASHSCGISPSSLSRRRLQRFGTELLAEEEVNSVIAT